MVKNSYKLNGPLLPWDYPCFIRINYNFSRITLTSVCQVERITSQNVDSHSSIDLFGSSTRTSFQVFCNFVYEFKEKKAYFITIIIYSCCIVKGVLLAINVTAFIIIGSLFPKQFVKGLHVFQSQIQYKLNISHLKLYHYHYMNYKEPRVISFSFLLTISTCYHD